MACRYCIGSDVMHFHFKLGVKFKKKMLLNDVLRDASEEQNQEIKHTYSQTQQDTTDRLEARVHRSDSNRRHVLRWRSSSGCVEQRVA